MEISGVERKTVTFIMGEGFKVGCRSESFHVLMHHVGLSDIIIKIHTTNH